MVVEKSPGDQVLKAWQNVEPTHDELSGGTHGHSLWWELEVNRVEEGTIDLPLKWKLTAAEEATQQFDSTNMVV